MTAARSDKVSVVRPASVEELATALRDSGGTVVVRGAGTHERWREPPEEPDLVIDMTAMDGVVEHSVGDLVVTVDAGILLPDLQQRVGTHRQWLALDPPGAPTVGGVLATADSGPRRLRFGPPRDLLLGVTVVLADGTVARSGGKVVKNVAGYDLGKLFTGSHGTLGVIAQATLRLHPVLVARRVVTVATDNPGPMVRAVLRSPATPTAIEWYADGDGAALHVVVESSEAAVGAQADTVAGLVGGTVSGDLPGHFGERPWRDGDLGLKVTHRIGAVDDVIAAVRDVAPDVRIRAHAGSGVLWLAGAAELTVIDDLRRRVAPYDGSVVAVAVPPALQSAIDVWGPVRGLEVMRRIKAQFDPQARMDPGRFVGGI
jgi:glycolate oxidase FAD binding subunit